MLIFLARTGVDQMLVWIMTSTNDWLLNGNCANPLTDILVAAVAIWTMNNWIPVMTMVVKIAGETGWMWSMRMTSARRSILWT